jgi:hypothetical protein
MTDGEIADPKVKFIENEIIYLKQYEACRLAG